jgi:hypothetical protein
METQIRVIASINKLKQIQAQRQQNFGAIEDAIASVKQELQDAGDMLMSLVDDYNSDIEDTKTKASELAEFVSNFMIEADGGFREYEKNYLNISQELDSLGIPYENVLYDAQERYEQAKSEADTLAFNLGN